MTEANRFEAEAAVTRERIAATIDELQMRLSPTALIDGAVDAIGTAGTRAVGSVRTAASGHPIAIGATGLAVGISLLAHSRLSRAKVEYGDSYAAYADYDEGYAANLAAGTPPTGATRAHLDAIQHQAHATVDDSPLGVVAVGLATGALLGAIVPVSAVEAMLFAEVRARFDAAGAAAIATARSEFHTSNLSLRGGTTGISERLTASLIVVLGSAIAALSQPVTTRSAG